MLGTASEEPDPQAIHVNTENDEEKARTSGKHVELPIDEPPLKKRRISEGASTGFTRKKPESPPWKRIAAEGPSSFTQDGVRKSARTNQVPLELQPPSDKRQTRGARAKTYSIKQASRLSLPSGRAGDIGMDHPDGKRRASSGKADTQHATRSTGKALSSPKRQQRRQQSVELSPTPARTYKRSVAAAQMQNSDSHTQPHRVGRPRRVSEDAGSTIINDNHSPDEHEEESQHLRSKLSRIRLRVNPPTLPLIHPELVLRRSKLFPTFKDFVENAGDLPIEQGGLMAVDEDGHYTTEMAKKDARLIVQMEDAAQDGGVLSPGISSAYRPEESDHDKRNTLRQYAHQDHLTRAATEFRLLMLEEHKKHKRAAKRLAEACRDEWHRKQPKTQEEIEAEAYRLAEARFKVVLKTLQGTWDNVKAEVNRRRLKEWEAEEQVRVRKALNEAVDISTQKLVARRARVDLGTDDELSDSSVGNTDDSSDEADSDSNMSSSGSESDDEFQQASIAGDEHLTVEELRQKYSRFPENTPMEVDDKDGAEPTEESISEAAKLLNEEAYAGGDSQEESDESVDMDDDMGSSDEEQDNDSDITDSENEEEEEAEHESLLGFLAPADRALLTRGTLAADSANGDDQIDDEDEVSLIPDASPMQNSIAAMQTSDLTVTSSSNQTLELNQAETPAHIEVDMGIPSPDQSSEPTSRTTETKPSEVDSASSIEFHQSSRHDTNSITPQPTAPLKTPIPFLLRGTLREYQHYGLDWLAGLYANNTNGILADEMGLGKTIQTIALLAHLACEHEVWGPHLVIVPTSVMLNWEMEFKKWCPGFKILTYYGTQEERKRKRQGWNHADTWNVCITSYQLVLQDQQVFKRRKWHYLILDEAHNVKNFRSQRWQTLLTFNTRARLLLTGTPLQNNLTELWSLLFFLMPSDGSEEKMSGFADLKEFSDWFRKPQEQILEHGRETMDDEARAIIGKLHKVLRPYLLRRLKADVEKQMPAKYEHVEYCRLSRRQRELYDGFLSRSDTRGTLASGNYLSIINCLMQLRKVCNHPDLFQERPILSSFPMKKSATADFEIKDLLLRRRLLKEEPMSNVSLDFLNLVPTRYERHSSTELERSAMLTAQRVLMDMREAQRGRAQYALSSMDPSSVKSNLQYLESASRWTRFEELQHCVYLNALRRQQRPIYGSRVLELFDFGLDLRQSAKRGKKPDRPQLVLDWRQSRSSVIRDMVPTLNKRSQELESTIQKFACITPPIVAPDALPLVLGPRLVEHLQTDSAELPDPFHEARMRLSVQFPDKRLLQYDCGKLQALDKLLRKLQRGGHRALIFTQMTKVLDILEQFLNIHGHKYLRLDGATKIEQRQILTDRFNNDTRILAFILSSRSGGLGINLTGADTVIFYDLDWNPAMDKQCQDRCHRIGQTREVHIYRLVSEHTIEANILRKANQKRMLDDVVIQEGEFTTDYFNKVAVRDVLGDEAGLLDEGDAAASAAMDRVLDGPGNGQNVQRVLEQAEDQEDVAAAKVAEKEIVQTDAADFDERLVSGTATAKTSGQNTPLEELNTPTTGTTLAPRFSHFVAADGDEDELNAWRIPIQSVDDYMLKLMTAQLKDTPLELPKDKSKSKRGKEHRSRIHRPR